ncbi:GlxA family transcriptional regulator [Salidesulfovibrio onnuriiensis]|uniref:GlxA family transcriptional regulator n=1 Tax=Salidesulfovibrio onnuriiensis TaxID=2583823 RepID=UPI00164EEC23|nr:helix-turn-helix domain-containing protein [Salidesulfovibrio onnuriiensis]
MTTIALLALEGCLSSSVFGPLDVFATARREKNENTLRIHSTIVGRSPAPVTSFSGIPVTPSATIGDGEQYDHVLIPALFGGLKRHLADRPVIDWIRSQHQGGACICTVCAGSFLLAETGLLAGRPATTHWGLAGDFRKRYPDVLLRADRMLLDEGDYICSGGATAYLELSLYLLGKLGAPELAAECSRVLLIDARTNSQTPYMSTTYATDHGDPEVLAVQQYIEKHLPEKLNIEELARKAGITGRTLNRRFQRALRISPLEFIQDLRLDKAKKMLATDTQCVEQIGYAVGYEDSASFRRVFRKKVGLTPGEYRSRFAHCRP